MKKKRIIATILAAQLMTGGVLWGCDSKAEDEQASNGGTVNLRILATTDMHSNLMNYDYYTDSELDNMGMVKVSTVIKDAKKEVDPNSNLNDNIDNVVIVDNGDDIQGTPLGDYYGKVNQPKDGEKSPVYETLEKMGYDVGGLGNHEFNYGLEYLQDVVSSSDMPFVNANVYKEDGETNVFNPYKIIDEKVVDSNGKEQNLKVGVIGVVPPQILNWDKINLDGKVKVADIKETAEKFVPQMKKEGADVIIALSHSGYGDGNYKEGNENEAYELTNIDGIDAVVTGHSHDKFPNEKYKSLGNVDVEKGTMNGTPTVQPLNFAKQLGVIDLTLSQSEDGNWKVVDGKSENRDVKGAKNDEELVEFLKPYHEATLQYVNGSVGQITKDLNSYFSLVADTAPIQLINDAQKEYVQGLISNGNDELAKYKDLPILCATAPLKAGLTEGGVNAEDYFNLKSGDLRIKDISNIYKFPNLLAIVKVKGSDVKEWLEMSAGQFTQIDKNSKEPQEFINLEYPGFNFDIIDGINYDIDISEAPKYDKDGNVINKDSNRIKNLTFNGQPLNMDQEFLVVTNNYRAGGGGHFPGLKSGDKLVYLSQDETRQILSDYIKAKSPLTPSKDNNWKIIGKGAQGKFLSNTNGKDYVGDFQGIEYVGDAENGLSNYNYTFSNQ
ncbi:bifunctional 2',3'-cyclic-nucleotide 2'-phosphodiesterase/3'-nucleotidase [Clostridium sp. B9]|uniref:bifunctional 2',3'-cyclic-nucleotide 2'-phosphodiesterase/3'-nucleotidase n=1 Tax=Clostridium sp. B9 TaxID=3423224 RepID=UPI003D2EEC9F